MQFTAEVAGKITKVCERYENRFGFSQLNNTMTPPPLYLNTSVELPS